MNMLAFQPPLNHWDSLEAVSKDNAAPQNDSAVSHKCAPSARVSSSSRWCVCVCVCVCVCEGQRCRFIPYAWMYTRTCAVICPSACYYCHMIKILFLHAYSKCTHLCYISTFNFPSACIINRCGIRRIQLGSLWIHSLPNALLFDTRWFTDERE